MSKPYFVTETKALREQPTKTGILSELKRLLGSPLRFLATLGLVILPLLLSLAGGLDLLSAGLYSMSHRGSPDLRKTVTALQCLEDTGKALCKGLAWGSTTSNRRIVFYPWHDLTELSQFEPQLFLFLFGLAFLAFVGIGNSRLKNAGSTLSRSLGLSKKVTTASLRAEGLIPNSLNGNSSKRQDNKEDDRTLQQWVMGGVVNRAWYSDPGYFELELSKQPEAYLISSKILQTGLGIVAPQGQGKTTSVFKPLLYFCRQIGAAAFFFDSKGYDPLSNDPAKKPDFDPAYFDYNFDLLDPSHSIRLNIYSGASPDQAGERLAEALIPELAEDKRYFSDNAKDTMAALVSAHFEVFVVYPELAELLKYLTEPDEIAALRDRVVDAYRGRQDEGLILVARLNRILQLTQNNKNDVLGSLATALSPLVANKAIASMLAANKGQDVYSVEELLAKPTLVRFGLVRADNPRIAPIIGRLILAQFTFAVLSPRCNTKIFKLAAVDEAHNFVTSFIATGMSQARSNNAGYALAFQTLAQIEEQTLLNKIFSNTGTKLVMAGVGDEDAEKFSRTFGEVELPYTGYSRSSSRSTGRTSGSNRSRGQEYEFFGGSSGTETRTSRGSSSGTNRSVTSGESQNETLRLRRMFLPSEIRNLPQYHAIIEASDASGQRWPAQVIDLRRNTVREIETKLLRERKIKPFQKAKKLKEGDRVRVVASIDETENPSIAGNGGSITGNYDDHTNAKKAVGTARVRKIDLLQASLSYRVAEELEISPGKDLQANPDQEDSLEEFQGQL